MVREALNPVDSARMRAIREHSVADLSDRSGANGIARFPKTGREVRPERPPLGRTHHSPIGSSCES